METKPRSLGKMMLVSTGVVLLIILVLVFWIVRRPAKAQVHVPEDLIGEWHTANANYADRSFEIDPVSISFGTGEGTVTTGFIKKVSAVQKGARTLYTIRYTTDGTVNQVSFYYEIAAKDRVIRFRNQEGIAWTKD